jgi:hypothetical protein
VVLSVESSNNGSSLQDEVVNVNLVGVIGVHVVLEVLNHVHAGLDALVSSNSWERERFVEELPGVDLWCLDSEFFSDLDGVEVVLLVELSGELVHLPVHLVLGDPESGLASTGLWGKGINDTSVLLEGHEVLNGSLSGGDGSEENQSNEGGFHFNNIL